MNKESTVMHLRIPNTLKEFVDRTARTPEFFNKNHVVILALKRLQNEIEGK